MSTSSVRLLDACGALLSGACAVHCALTPLLITALPAIANHGAETMFRRVLIVFGILGVAIGAWVHKSREALLPLSWAILLALAFELHWVQSSVEVFPSLLLSGCLITAHALNSRACHKKSLCCAADRCEEPFWGLIGPASSKGPSNAPIVISAAILLHALVIALAVHAPVAPVPAAVAVSEVQIDLAEPPALEPAPVAAAPSPQAEPAIAPRVAAAPPVAAAPAPVAFNQPLTAPLGASGAADAPVKFASVLGAGAPGKTPGGVSGATTNAVAGGQGAPSAKGDATVSVRELSRRPVPPSGLDGLVKSHYPASLRAQQLEGTGSARLLIEPSGVVGSAVPSAESVPGFAAACADAMRKTSGWGTPLDREGRPVSTWIHFTCEFTIRH